MHIKEKAIYYYNFYYKETFTVFHMSIINTYYASQETTLTTSTFGPAPLKLSSNEVDPKVLKIIKKVNFLQLMKCIFQDKSTFVGLAISAWFSALVDVNTFNTYREHWLSESLNALLETMAIIIVSCHDHVTSRLSLI